jgi:hypothetical protein
MDSMVVQEFNKSRPNQSTFSAVCKSTAVFKPFLSIVDELLDEGVDSPDCRDALVEFLGRPGRLEELLIQSVCDLTHRLQASAGWSDTRMHLSFCVLHRSQAARFGDTRESDIVNV